MNKNKITRHEQFCQIQPKAAGGKQQKNGASIAKKAGATTKKMTGVVIEEPGYLETIRFMSRSFRSWLVTELPQQLISYYSQICIFSIPIAFYFVVSSKIKI